MKVRLLASLSGSMVSFPAGSVVEFESGEARSLIENGVAEPVARKPADRAEKRGPGRPRKKA